MNKYRSAKIVIAVIVLLNIMVSSINVKERVKKTNAIIINLTSDSKVATLQDINEEIVYENMTINQLGEKIEKNLNSTLKGYGKSFAKYSIKYQVDPYVATSIVLLETGCKWNCSNLVKKCNNVGGMKGKNNCPGSSYAKFDTLEDGIEAFFKNLSNNYYKKGLTTPKEINKKYATNPEWYKKVESYVKQIKSS